MRGSNGGYAVILVTMLLTVAGIGWFLLSAADAVPDLSSRIPSFSPSFSVSDRSSSRADGPEAVVSQHELATEAGMDILAAGGTAADASVAVAAVLSVVEPWFSSALGGGTWALYYEGDTGAVTSLDGVGPTGSNASAEAFSSVAGQQGMHQAVVPGAWDGWMLWLEEYGELGLDEILAPAITIAREGYEVSEEMEYWLDSQADRTQRRPDTARIYVRDGSLVRAGDTIQQTDMADTFEALAEAYTEAAADGDRTAGIQAARDYFYRGPIAEAIVAASDAGGGYLTLPDFENFSASIVEPINTAWNDELTVYQNPPNSQGITMLLALNFIRDFPFSEWESDGPDAVHVAAEGLKLAFTDRHFHVGDPARIDVPTAGLLSDEHTARQRERIDMESALSWPISDGYIPEGAGNTTTFQVTDRHGNGAAITTSTGAQFHVIGDTGIHINYRMRFLALAPGDTNRVDPGYKVRHTSNPYIALKNDQLYILGGNTGGDSQAQGQVQQFLRVVEHGLSAQEAIAHPRFMVTSFPGTIYSYPARNQLQMESEFPTATVNALEARGHRVVIDEGTWGDASMIVFSEDGSELDLGVETRSSVSSGQSR